MATQQDDVINVQRGNQAGVGGDDTYILSPALIDDDAAITISDTQGTNKIQLIGGLSIASSIVAGDTVQLTLSNGAVITVLGASTFSYEIGGNPLTGAAGTINDYDEFATDVLGATVPAEGEDPVDGGPATIPADTPPVDTTAPVFSSAEADGTSVVLTYDEDLDSNSIPAAGDFDVLVGGTAATVSDVSVSGSEVTLTLDAPVKSTDTLTVAYTQPASNRVQDSAGNDAETLAATEVTNETELTFELTASSSTGTEGADITYTITASEELAADTVVTFTVAAGDPDAADQGTTTTNLNDFSTGTFNPAEVTIAAGTTSTTFGVSAEDDGITELPETYIVSAEVNGTTLEITSTVNDGTVGGGDIFTLTASADTLPGTTGNDTYIAAQENGMDTLAAGDTLNGGGGTDRLNIFGDDNAAEFGNADIADVENVFTRFDASSATNSTIDVSSNQDVEQAWVDSGSTVGAATVTLTKDQTAGIMGELTTIATNLEIIFDDASAAAGDEATLALSDANTTDGTDVTIDDIETLNVAAVGANHLGTLADTGNSTEMLNVTGSGSLNAIIGSTALETVNGSNEDGMTLDLSASDANDQTITGGAGDDAITSTWANLTAQDTVDLGDGEDAMIFTDAVTVTNATQAEGLDNVSNIEELGVNGAVALTVDADLVDSAINIFSIDTTGASAVITDAAEGVTLVAKDGVMAASSIATKLGADTVNVSLEGGAAAVSDLGTNGLTITGSSDVNVSSSGLSGVGANTLGLTVDDNNGINVSGGQDLTLTTANAGGVTGLTINGAATFTGDLTVAGTAQEDDITGGEGQDFISGGAAAASGTVDVTTDGASGADSLTGGAGDDAFGITALSLDQANMVTVNDFQVGDALIFGLNANAGTFLDSAIDVSAAGDLDTALDIADTGTANNISWFNFESNTYVIAEGAVDNDQAADSIVKLAGVLDLSDSSVANAATGDVLTFG